MTTHTSHMNSPLSTPTRRWSRLTASAVIAVIAPLVAVPALASPTAATAGTAGTVAAADSPGRSDRDTPRTVWATDDPSEARAHYGDVRRLRIRLEGRQVEVLMRFWRGRNEFLPDLLDIDIDTRGGPAPEYRATYDSAASEWIAIYRIRSETDRRVCAERTASTRERPSGQVFRGSFPIRCLTPGRTGRPDRVRFRVANQPEDHNFGPDDIVPGGVWGGGGKPRPWGPWLDARR